MIRRVAGGNPGGPNSNSLQIPTTSSSAAAGTNGDTANNNARWNNSNGKREGDRGGWGLLHNSQHHNHHAGRRIPLVIVVATAVMGLAVLCMGLVGIYSVMYIADTNASDKNNIINNNSRNYNRMDRPPPLPNGRNLRKDLDPNQAREILRQVTRQFEERYGGGIVAREMLARGVHAFGSVDATAHRIAAAAREGRPFVMAFSGYSVTVGRGNFFNQSFPFVVRDVLRGPMEHIFGVPLVVRNAAIGGIPSFPYGFCLEHFLGPRPDVISWDYSMNEGPKDASVLEAFLRQASQQLGGRGGNGNGDANRDRPERAPSFPPPMVIMMDTNANRMRVLDDYTQKGWLQDAIAVGKKEILDEKKVFAMDPLPPGFQEWDEFGAPKKCPGRGNWHPKRQEHAMIGWMIAMHFVRAMERAVEIQENPTLLVEMTTRLLAANEARGAIFTEPLSPNLPDNDPEVTELLYGHLSPSDGNDEYVMKDLSCRTSFLPAIDEGRTIKSVIVSGLAGGGLDIMVDRTDQHYEEGWVLDVSNVERDTKRKVESCGGLGYIDMKIALYGVPESGKLRLWLPFEGPSHGHHDHDMADVFDAKHWFDDLLVCEANEKRGAEACKLDQDMDVAVGGVTVDTIRPIHGAGEYLKRTTCVNIGVPDGAKVTRFGDVRTTQDRPLSNEDKKSFGVNDDVWGLVVDITAKSKVTRTKGACCLSHIVWEQH